MVSVNVSATVKKSLIWPWAHQGYHYLGVALLSIAGLFFVAQGSYMQAKAYVAQFLIAQAWQQTLIDQQQHKPWSWADTYPVAKLTLMSMDPLSAQKSSMYVLAGASGRNLAFAPAQVLSSAAINGTGNTVIAGHRDSHFSVLEHVQMGQLLSLQSHLGDEVVYQVMDLRVVDESDMSVMATSDKARLTLVTCYPFNRPIAGGPLRYIVSAVAVDKVERI